MTAENSPAGFTATQIILHWTIAALIVFQLVFGEDIKPAYRAFNRGNEPASGDLFNANLHVYVGVAVLVLAILRFAIRLRRGAGCTGWRERSRATHCYRDAFRPLPVHLRHAGNRGAGLVSGPSVAWARCTNSPSHSSSLPSHCMRPQHFGSISS